MATNEIADVVQQVQNWPVPMRISLARQILESVEHEPADVRACGVPRGPSAAEVAARFGTEKPAPDDQAVKQWVDEHRLAKYGS
jgi:hypothetical protein